MSRRLIVGNLDAEAQLCGETLSPGLLGGLAGFSTLLRAFALAGDELRTFRPVAAERMADVPGLPRPQLACGPPTPGSVPILAWAETPEVASARPPETPAPETSPAGPLHEVVWRWPRSSPETFATVHHRGFCLELARETACALPGARMVGSLEDLESRNTTAGAWVLKAPLSAAGRSRYIHRGGELDPKGRRTLERLFERHRSLLFEPWMDRVEDVGCVALLAAHETRLVGFHRQRVDRSGRFRGIELRAAFDGLTGLSDEDGRRMEAAVEAVGSALREAGYRGPFGIDAWRYRREDGTIAFHPLGEINARMSFGLVARALVDRLREPLELDPRDEVRLVLSRRGAEIRAEAPAKSGIVPLLSPGPDGTAAWLEIGTPEAG